MKFTRSLYTHGLSRLGACAGLALALAIPLSLASAEEPLIQLKDNDVWVMAGDSITAQRLHTNYIEAFYRTRYPQLHLHFRNSGIGGNRTGNILARFDYDVAAWKPTIVSIELGMNDVNGSEETYIKGMKELIAKIRAIHAQPLLISSSPVDDGSIMNDWRSQRCEKLNAFTNALKKLAEEEKVPMVDQYHFLVDLWGQNRRKGAEKFAASGQQPPPPAPAAPGKPAKPFIPPSLIPLTGDAVHTGSVGQYTMASAILTGLHVSGEVSSATVGMDGKVANATRCKITDVTAKDGKLSFTRLDEASPWPILPAAKSAFQLLPSGLELSRYMLKVPGLATGDYHVSINGKVVATVNAQQLAEGWNITTAYDGPLGDRANTILNLISKLESPLNLAWRAASKAKDTAKLEQVEKEIEATEAQIQTAVQPVALKFEIAK